MSKRASLQTSKSRPLIFGGVVILVIVGGFFVFAYGFLPVFSGVNYSTTAEVGMASSTFKIVPGVLHLPTPEPLKAIYMTSCVVGTKKFRDSLVALANRTEINSILIDIKDFSGTLSFVPENPKFKSFAVTKCGARDMKSFIKSLHEKGLYVIGRIAVFQDPTMVEIYPELAVKKKSDGSVWKDYKGLSFIDVGAKPHWGYVVELSKEAYGIGFDEINFDYVRFPSDGNMKDIDFTLSRDKTKAEALREFFAYLHDELKGTGVKTSVDLFGMTTTNNDDLNIGQLLENALPYFDYVSPMVYPSHYPPNFNGWKNPNDHAYEVVKLSMDRAVERTISTTTKLILFNSAPIAPLTSSPATATTSNNSLESGSSTPSLYSKTAYSKLKLRPWLQDFQYGGTYGPKEVRAQIQATYDAGLTSWMLWSPSNRYTEGALLK